MAAKCARIATMNLFFEMHYGNLLSRLPAPKYCSSLKCHLFLRDFEEDIIVQGFQYLKNKAGLDLLFALKTDERSRKPKAVGFEPERERKPNEVGSG